MQATTQVRNTASGSTNTSTHETNGKDKKAQLRSMSYDEGVKALSPDGAITKKDEKKPESKKPGKDGLPPEIEALDLKKVTVECSMEAWEALDETEKAAVLTFLAKKEESCEKSKKLKSSKVTISMGATIENIDDEELAQHNADAKGNAGRMSEGKTPNLGKKGATIGVQEGDVEVTKTETTKTTKVPVKETKQLESHFDAKGSTFDSADYEPEDMQQSGVMDLLTQAAEKVKEYLALDPEAKITFTVTASESHVPNPKGFEKVGSLAQARADNGVALAKAHFEAMGIDESHLVFTTNNLGANGPDWDPKIGKHDAMYTAHQFVRLDVSAEVSVEGEGTEDKTETEVTETKTQDAQLVKMTVADDRKRSRKKKGGGGRAPRVRRHKKTKKFRTIDCPIF